MRKKTCVRYPERNSNNFYNNINCREEILHCLELIPIANGTSRTSRYSTEANYINNNIQIYNQENNYINNSFSHSINNNFNHLNKDSVLNNGNYYNFDRVFCEATNQEEVLI